MPLILLALFGIMLMVAVVAFGAALYLAYRYLRLKAQTGAQIEVVRTDMEQSLTSHLQTRTDGLQHQTRQDSQHWREQELGFARQQPLDMARAEAEVQFAQWKTVLAACAWHTTERGF